MFSTMVGHAIGRTNCHTWDRSSRGQIGSYRTDRDHSIGPAATCRAEDPCPDGPLTRMTCSLDSFTTIHRYNREDVIEDDVPPVADRPASSASQHCQSTASEGYGPGEVSGQRPRGNGSRGGQRSETKARGFPHIHMFVMVGLSRPIATASPGSFPVFTYRPRGLGFFIRCRSRTSARNPLFN